MIVFHGNSLSERLCGVLTELRQTLPAKEQGSDGAEPLEKLTLRGPFFQ